MRTNTKLTEPYDALQEPFHFLKEHDRHPTNKIRDVWDDTDIDPAKVILCGILMGGLLWVAILLLVIF